MLPDDIDDNYLGTFGGEEGREGGEFNRLAATWEGGASDRLVSCLVASQVFCSCYLDLKYR